MRILLQISLLLHVMLLQAQDITLKDKKTNEPLAFATISFENGRGTFADDKGVFKFSKTLYPDVSQITIISIGYPDTTLAVNALTNIILIEQETNELGTVILRTQLTGKFKNKEIQETEHQDYFNTWSPTVESEIAVLFNRIDEQPTQFTSLQLPVVLENSQVSERGAKRKFSTLFRISFYDVLENGSPASKSNYPIETFVINQESKPVYEHDISHLNMTIPEKGIFVAIQILGTTDLNGNLIDAKKYREIRTRTGTEKVSTTYRPLLPFTDKLDRVTWVRRIFLNSKTWQVFDLSYNGNSSLVRSGHVNYGLGAKFKVYYNN